MGELSRHTRRGAPGKNHHLYFSHARHSVCFGGGATLQPGKLSSVVQPCSADFHFAGMASCSLAAGGFLIGLEKMRGGGVQTFKLEYFCSPCASHPSLAW